MTSWQSKPSSNLSSFARMVMYAVCATAIIGSAHAAVTDTITTRPNVIYATPDGQELMLDVFMPATSSTQEGKLRPAFALIHGGGWAGGARWAYHSDARWFAEHGIVCFTISYRLVKPDANKWPTQFEDVQAAIRWIREHAHEYGADGNRVAAMGGSAGGHLVAMLGTEGTTETVNGKKHGSKPDCIINFAGPSDLTRDFPTSGPFNLNVQKLVDDFLGKPADADPAQARSASPRFHATSDDVPFLTFHGDKDTVVPLRHAKWLNKALKEAGVESELVILKDEGHGLKPENLKLVREKTLEFINKHLGSEADQ